MLNFIKKSFLKKINLFNLWILLFFLGTITLGVSFRSVEILSNNYLFGFDQGRDYLAVKSIIEDGKLTLIGSEIGAGAAGFSGIFQGPFHYYFLAVPYILFNGSPYGGMALTYIYGILTIFLIFVIGKKMFGNFGGLFAGGLAAISPPLISQARFIWNSHGAPVFVLLSLFFVYKLCEKVRYRYIFLSAFFAAFIYNFQIAISVPMSISLLVLMIFILKVKDIRKYLILVLGFIVGFLPMVLFEFRHNFMAISGLVDYLIGPKDIEGPGLILTMQSHIPSFIGNLHNTFIRQDFIRGEFIGIFLFAAALFFIVREKNKIIKKFISYLLTIPFVTFFVLGFLNNAVWDYYLLHLVLVYILIFTYIFFSSYLHRKYFLTILIVLFLTLSFAKLTPDLVKNIFYDFQDYGGTHKMKGKIDALDFIYNDAKGEEFGLFVFTPPIYTYSYDYLMEWYGVSKYGYKPAESKDKTFYLLIEADNNDLLRHQGWLETVIVEGEVIKETTLPSGFIIQKRINNL